MFLAQAVWNSWGAWSACSKSCGVGEKTHERTCLRYKPTDFINYCEGSQKEVMTESEECELKPCRKLFCFYYSIL